MVLYTVGIRTLREIKKKKKLMHVFFLIKKQQQQQQQQQQKANHNNHVFSLILEPRENFIFSLKVERLVWLRRR
jgi:hypothetical protein